MADTPEEDGIIPAYAGSTCRRQAIVTTPPGSSPHTRGALRLAGECCHPGGIIPAYAGSTIEVPATGFPTEDHPRIRGEHRLSGLYTGDGQGSSPHTRGAPPTSSSSARSRRIIPAYAGSTSAAADSCRRSWDHPRIRGEHSAASPSTSRAAGSSPHTRGAHLEIPAIPRIAAVIIPVFLYPSPTPQEEADRSMVLLTLS